MKKNNLLCVAMLAFVVFAFVGCKKDAANPSAPETVNQKVQPAVESGRLVFSSQESYFNYIKDIAGKPAIKREGFTSLSAAIREISKNKIDQPLSERSKELLRLNLPLEFKHTLNEKAEVKIGDEIIWYNQDRKYFIPASSEKDLETIKQNPAAIAKSFATNQVKIATSPDPSGRVNLNFGALDARHQHEFFLYGASHFKHVHEVFTHFENTGGGAWTTYVALRIKLEWKGCCDWNPASETRDVSINVTGSANLYNGTGTIPAPGTYLLGPAIAVNESDAVTGDYEVTLGAVNGSGSLLAGSHWTLRLSGTIYHYVQNDLPGNAWTNSGNPLW